jgi:hypothetical protein
MNLTFPATLLVTGSVLAALVIGFLVWFLVPALRHWQRLRAVKAGLGAVSGRAPEKLKTIFSVDARLAHLWKQYEETLHRQTEDRDGRSTVIAIRSTVPADAYFNSQTVVDGRLGVEFFKHLPGIFTGVGIIGTFSGLIKGLGQFQTGFGTSGASPAPGATNRAVENLLAEVHTAFWVSAAAIAAAMIVTFVEKFLVASLYRLTEEIADDIDSRFVAGAGEEYLSRLVQASEESASQSRILKDALVGELTEILREISRSQITATHGANQVLATAISGSITESLSQPMKDIAGTVRAASGDQSAAASRLLQDVLASFSQRLNDLFGGQIAGLNDLNRGTAESMQEVVRTLNALVARMESTSEASSDAMAKRMAEAVEKMEQRQQSINAQTTAFVEQLRLLVASSQSETNAKMQQALELMAQQVAGVVESLRAANDQALDGNRGREEVMAQRTASAVSSMAGSVDTAVKEMAIASTRMQDAVARIAQVTTTALDRMNYGAETLSTATGNFAQAGERVSGAMGQAATVAGKMVEVTGALTAGASALRQTLGDYQSQREAVAALVAELRALVESARREASLTTDVLARIQSASDKLAVAQVQANDYLDDVSEVLAKAHQAFAEETTRTLGRANTDFQSKLAASVNLLHATIQELETTISESK